MAAPGGLVATARADTAPRAGVSRRLLLQDKPSLPRLAKHALRLIERMYPGPSGLEFLSSDIGGGLYISHGAATTISALEIGRNCRIHQTVTVGWAHNSCPRIGNDVTLYPGAVVIGDVTVGDGAVIAAGAVVTKDVPGGKIAAGVPARVIGNATTSSHWPISAAEPHGESG